MLIEGLTFAYAKTVIFENFGFDSESSIITLRGPSGCGKSTLLKLLAGYYKPINVSTWNIPEQSRIILQEDALFPWLTGEANLTLFCKEKYSSAHIESHPMFAICRDVLTKRASEMSFGQRRLVELFRCFLTPTPLICLDEPLNFLDKDKRASVAEIIKQDISKHSHLVMPTHYPEDNALLDCESYEFDGNFPVTALRRRA